MKSIYAITFYTLAIILFCNCKGIYSITNDGESIIQKSTFWKFSNNKDTPYIVLSEKAWYKDSLGITEICQIWSQLDDTVRTSGVRTIGYRFTDLRKKWAYHYESFTETAKITRKYHYSDTTVFSGGWNFDYPKSMTIENLQVLSDTIVSGIKYKQSKITISFNEAYFEGIGMFRFDKKNSVFTIDKELGKKVGGPLVYLGAYPIENHHAKLEREIKFLSNNMPDSVIKIFEAWKRNEKLFPVL